MGPTRNRDRWRRRRLALGRLIVLPALGWATAASLRAAGAAAGPEGSFFIVPIPDIDRPTAHPTVGVDATGGVHVAFTPDTNTSEDPTRPAYYAYCPSNCTSAAAFTVVPLGAHVDYANLVLDGTGHPRMLLRLTRPSDQKLVYEYWACDGTCTSGANWTSVVVAEAFPRPVATGEQFSRFFAIDAAGRPGQIIFCITPSPPIWGLDVRETSSFLPMVAKRMVKVIPRLKNLRVRRTWRGLYPMTPDGLPIVGETRELSGFILAVGMCGQGFMLGPGLGELLARLVQGRLSDEDKDTLSYFSPYRNFRGGE